MGVGRETCKSPAPAPLRTAVPPHLVPWSMHHPGYTGSYFVHESVVDADCMGDGPQRWIHSKTTQ